MKKHLFILSLLLSHLYVFAQETLKIKVTVTDPSHYCTGTDIKLDSLYFVALPSQNIIIPIVHKEEYGYYYYTINLQPYQRYEVRGFLQEYDSIHAVIDSSAWVDIIKQKEYRLYTDNQAFPYNYGYLFFKKKSSQLLKGEYNMDIIKMVVNNLKKYPKTKISLIGYASDKEKNPMELGLKRAENIKKLLVEKYNILPEKIRCVSEGNTVKIVGDEVIFNQTVSIKTE